ncbi:hypothetical protein DH2020_039961 [Rehmannia glutinosa]|uniref:BTB domain-containing protein n=2 Tax=Rehmannia glutinosa TaxID=99300 RepID=A0ABR0UVL1_REHGL
MASMGQNRYSDDLLTLICSESNGSNPDEDPDEVIISTAEISSWDLPSILAHKVIKIKANRSRQMKSAQLSIQQSKLVKLNLSKTKLIEESSYFRGLLCGSFSESRLGSISIHWNMESFVSVLRVIYGCYVEISSDNFIPLNESVSRTSNWEPVSGSIIFGVDVLLLKCRVWLDELTSFRELGQQPQLSLGSLIQIWKYGMEHGKMWALTFNSYTDVPEKTTMLFEKHLCDAILVWLAAKTAKSEGWCSNELCEKLKSYFFHAIAQKVDVSGCPQLTTGLFLLSMLPSSDTDLILRKIIKKSSINHANSIGDGLQISQGLGQMLTFEAVQELDISNCPSLSLESAVDCFSKSFPSLRSLRAAYFLCFKTKKLCQLVQKLPLLSNIDLTLDINPVIPAQVSITASSSVLTPQRSTESFGIYNCHSASSLSYTSRPLLSNIMKLTLEGRTDISDSDLLIISEVCCSLSYVNMKGCTSVTDHGISVMILKCKMLQSVLACDTSFGNNSILALCSGISSGTQQSEKHSQLMAHKLLTLHIGGCHGITGNILSELMSGADHLRSLCLREIQIVDDALYRFSGASLEMLDVSDTKVSSATLSHVIHRNPGLKSLKARGCRHLLLQESAHTPEELYSALGNLCKLEEIELGWGFSFFSLGDLKPAIRTLRTLVVGLGGSLGPDGLKLLPTICPILETLILYFQVISDSAITDIIKTLPYLQSLALCYCYGDISSLSFKFGMPNLSNLKLERVTPWMTDDDLATLAENCVNLVKLSLIGCTLLDSEDVAQEPNVIFNASAKHNTLSLLSVSFVEAQDIISSGWPGLTSLHLEECGEITASGVISLLDCHALEDLIIRHTGRGIPRNFIVYAASKLPMLRKISLDICDSREGDFDIPSFSDRYFLSIVKIARCKLQKSTLDLHNLEARRNPVHKETLVLVWNSEKLVRTVTLSSSGSSSAAAPQLAVPPRLRITLISLEIMPKVKTNRVKYPEGWELIEPTLRELQAKMREAENDPHDGKRKCEGLWPIFKIAHQKSRYVFDLYHRRKEISKELYEFCLDQGYADRNLIAKWKKPGYERLCCLRCMQPRDHNFQTTCVCRVPKHLREEKVIECVHCGCGGCASGD